MIKSSSFLKSNKHGSKLLVLLVEDEKNLDLKKNN
jgi:hypothetical protein